MAKGYKRNDPRGMQTAFNQVLVDDIEVNRLYWQDVFCESAAALASTVFSKAHWTGAGTNGTQAISSAAVMTIDTTATGSSTSTLTGNQTVWTAASNSSMQINLTPTSLTNEKASWGWYASANDYVLFRYDTAVSSTSIVIASKNNGGTEVVTTLPFLPVASTYNKYRIDLLANGNVRCYIDQKEYLHSGTVYTVAFGPQIYVDNKAVAQSNKILIDEVRLSSDNY